MRLLLLLRWPCCVHGLSSFHLMLPGRWSRFRGVCTHALLQHAVAVKWHMPCTSGKLLPWRAARRGQLHWLRHGVCQRPSPLRSTAGLNTFLVHVCCCLHAAETERSTRAQVSRWRSAALARARASPGKSHPKVWCRVLSQYTLRKRCMQIPSCACSAFAHAVRRLTDTTQVLRCKFGLR